jgi:magnesium chelatase subunit D
MLEIVTGYPVVSVTLGTFEAEDELWGSLGLSSESHRQLFQWNLGLLAAGQNDSALRLVVIPDLAKLSLAAARACVVLMGADVVHLERHGQQAHWQPNLCWVAGCTTSEIGMISPHLLDRFALRLSGRVTKAKTPEDRSLEILKLIDDLALAKETKPEPLPTEISDRLKKALQLYPTITPKATARIIDYTPHEQEAHSERREIALARLSLAHARLEGAAQMTAAHVDVAALMIGLKPVAKQTEKLPDVPAAPETPKTKDVTPTSTPTKSTPTEQPQSSTVKVPVYESDQQELLPSMPLTFSAAYEAPVNPYPEDTAPVEREAASLKLPSRRFRSKTIARGPIIGVEKATSLQDIALVRTLLETAKFQSIRQKSVENSNNGLILSPKDLHSYRRAPVAEQMLMLVLDHTCLKDCKWQDALLPYLSWAYVERASICLIQVGVADACHELQAEKVMAQSILTPRISAGIEAKGGKATPLAHGLDLALQTLRHALQHGRSTVQQVVLVVISDGRGNVPLEASRFNRKPHSVKRQGIEDALNIAKSIASLDNVQTVLLNPQSKAYPELPLELAKALGAKVVLIPLQETWELEP